MVAGDFPSFLLVDMLEEDIEVEIARRGLYPERVYKDDDQCALIEEGNAVSAAGFAEAERLRVIQVFGRMTMYSSSMVKCSLQKRLRAYIDHVCVDMGAHASHTIVAGGERTCDPHCVGSAHCMQMN